MEKALFPETRLIASGLTLRRGDRLLVEELDFDLANGQALIVTGPNGTGKSTLLRGLAGFLPPARGRVQGIFAGEEERGAGALAHYLGHVEGSKPALTARENLHFWQSMLALPGLGSGLSPDEALTQLGVPQVAGLPVAYLSAGQKRRVGLARLLIAPRPIWILDEPLTALDAAGQDLLNAMLRDHLAAGGLIVAATHAPLAIAARQLSLGSREVAA